MYLELPVEQAANGVGERLALIRGRVAEFMPPAPPPKAKHVSAGDFIAATAGLKLHVVIIAAHDGPDAAQKTWVEVSRQLRGQPPAASPGDRSGEGSEAFPQCASL